MIVYRTLRPAIDEYRLLFNNTGWTAPNAISDNVFQKVIENSWHWVSAYDDGKIVGTGRVVSDGALYAFICDMIVLPAYRRQGIGSMIIKMLKDKCVENNFLRVWLFSAPGRSGFYIRNGFEIRQEDAPGMQMKKSDDQ
jgi:GNAT superfamily N-acetyltransferase